MTSDDLVAIEELATFRVEGFGGSDMSAALQHLAADSETTAAVVITDGIIAYPDGPLLFDVLWVIYGHKHCNPPYGHVLWTGVEAS